jgi:anthranilate phosphoribosyltransferase
LLAMLLARAGAPVLVHGVLTDAGRVTTAEIFRELGIRFATSHDQAAQQWKSATPVFMPIQQLAPRLAELLSLRAVLGVRNSTHTLVKIIQPFAQRALRLSSYTHPEYANSLADYFTGPADPARGPVMLMRATEGETVANVKKVQKIDLIAGGTRSTLSEAEPGAESTLAIPADAAGTAHWIRQVLDGTLPVPDNIHQQVQFCLSAARIGTAE